jgi:RimJ/RimL family protein N-acetyltransferase
VTEPARDPGVTDAVHIRPAAPGDAPALVELARAVSSEPEGWLISGGGWRSVGEERRYLRAVRRHPDGAVFVAETADGVVGRLSLTRDPHPSSHHVADLGLMVAAASRRRGIGYALLSEAAEWARAAGVRKLELHVFPHNDAALALYARFGFREEGYRRAHYHLGGGRYVDAILMAYDIDGPIGTEIHREVGDISSSRTAASADGD